MSDPHSHGIGPYRLVRNRDGQKAYFAGHHDNGQPRWVDNQQDGVHYPEAGMAATVQRTLTPSAGESLNVVRVTR